MKETLRSGDTVLVWDISRLGRSTSEMIKVVEYWITKKIAIKSIQEPFIDTTTESGEFVIKLFIILAESERKRILRRTNDGLEAARARGRIGGRKKGLSAKAIDIAKKVTRLYNSKQLTTAEICSSVKISRATLYKYLRHEGALK
ncbi:DNA invertase Pin-like site-specific DNA recombinase [Pedobacter sp. UYP30]